ncbi:MAG: FGGY family carbohydrate kinase [Firmicutes bacterium]|nr:FGGY family carbohydrate kinase [Bacillota bacterium]
MYLALDVGTTIAKGVLFNKNGKELLVVEKPLETIIRQKDFYEQDPEQIKETIYQVLKELFSSQWKDEIKAIILSTQGGAIIPINKEGKEIYPFISWLDNRAGKLMEDMKKDGTAKIVREKSGWWPQVGLPFVTLSWLRDNEPEIFGGTDKFLSLNDYLGFVLTGNCVTNLSCAGEVLLANSIDADWDPELCRILGIKKEQLSVIKEAEAIVGHLTKEIADKIGASINVPVINGGQDHTLEALAFGINGIGKSMLACGTAWVINCATDSGELKNIPNNMDLNFHILKNKWVISQYLGSFGGNFEWWMNNFWQDCQGKTDRKTMFSVMNESIENTKFDKSLIYLPYSGGRQLDGVREFGNFINSDTGHNRADFTRAMMEGSAFEVRWALDNLEQYGIRIDELWMIGGTARSKAWTQIIADVLGVSVYKTNYTHGPALGAALIGGVSLGDYPNYEEARKVFKIEATVVEPNMKMKEMYDIKFEEVFKSIMVKEREEN